MPATQHTSRNLTERDWADFSRDGYLHLGMVLEPDEVEQLKQRADDLALGRIVNPNIQMQLDTGGAYEELPAAVERFEGGTLLYRKIQGLEQDELFRPLVQHPLFLEICRRSYGAHTGVSVFRAMIMNKPAGQGTELPWHQDGGNVWALDRDPLVTIWVALDQATTANGCMEAIPGSHRLGLLSLNGSTVADDLVAIHCPADRIQPLEVEAGHALLIHNWLIHRSGTNPSQIPRRAFTMCCMDARTRNTLTGDHFPVIGGSWPLEPDPYVKHLVAEREHFKTSHAVATEYALGLEQENRALRAQVERTGAAKAAARLGAGGMVTQRVGWEAMKRVARLASRTIKREP